MPLLPRPVLLRKLIYLILHLNLIISNSPSQLARSGKYGTPKGLLVVLVTSLESATLAGPLWHSPAVFSRTSIPLRLLFHSTVVFFPYLCLQWVIYIYPSFTNVQCRRINSNILKYLKLIENQKLFMCLRSCYCGINFFKVMIRKEE